jgi:hypothetical protein
MQLMPVARSLALDKAGNSMAAKMAIMAMTTSNSIKVNPRPADDSRRCGQECDFGFFII